jgi:prevent-host-death family protein
MERTVGAFEARRNFGKLLEEVVAKGDKIVVERHGEPVAVVVPVEVYRQWQRSRAAFFDRATAIAERVNLSPEEADKLAAEAVRWARRQSEK